MYSFYFPFIFQILEDYFTLVLNPNHYLLLHSKKQFFLNVGYNIIIIIIILWRFEIMS